MRGQDCKTYYSTAAYSSPSWSEITRVVNDTITPTREEITGANRSSEAGSTDVGTLRLSGSLTYEYAVGSTDTVYPALQDAFFSKTRLDMLFVDGAYATASGWRAPMHIVECPQRRDLDGVVEVTIELRSTVWNDSGTLRSAKRWRDGADVS